MASQVSPSTTALPAAAPTPMDDMTDDAPNGPDPKRWFFDKERLEHTPSRKCGIDADKELMYRQQSANFIQDMGQRLHVNQLCINTAIVYMHRFYMYHSFSHFHQNHVSTAAIFLAAKVEEQPRKLEHVIKVAHYCLNRDAPQIDTKSEAYAEQAQELVMTENILLQTLGFDVAIDHPHTHVVKCCQLVRASKDLAQTSYFMATNSLHLTTMCLQYKPTVVACVCIHLTCKWSNWEIPRSKEGRDWFWYVDDTVTMEQLEKLTTEFLAIFDKSPSRLKKKILSLNQSSGGSSSLALSAFPTINIDPKSPSNPQPPARSSPATSHPSSSQSLKRSSVTMKSSGTPISSKQAKVNGGIGHHSVKPPHGSQPPSSNSSSKHPHYSSSSGNKGILPPGSHHGAKEAHSMQAHMKQPGHHHSSSGHPPPSYPHGPSSSSSNSSSNSSSSRPSSHPHPGMHHNPPHQSSGGQPSKSSSSSHALPGQQHPPKPPHPQPSKVPYNYNMKSQLPPPSQSVQPKPPSSSGPASQGTTNPSLNKPHFQPPPYNQVKKPYPEPVRRENATTSDFNGKREAPEDASRRSTNLSSQSTSSRARGGDKLGGTYNSASASSNLPAVSLPFNATTTSETSRIWTDNGSSVVEPRIPPGRTSLFSPDPELMESSSFISSSIQSIVKPELSPIGDLSVGAKGSSVNCGDGDSTSDNFFSMPSSVSSSLFPNLFEYGMGSRGADDMKPETSNLPSSEDGPTESAPLNSTASVPVINPEPVSTAVPMTSGGGGGGLKLEPESPSRRILDSLHEDEPPHKKVKKNKKEKHKHKDKDRHEEKKDRKDKEEKKHKDKNRDKSREDRKHKEKHKEKKHKGEKERDKSKAKYPNETESPGYTDGAGNRLKINLTSRIFDAPVSESKSKSKHSSKKHSSKSNVAPSVDPSSATPSIKLKIVPPRPPNDDGKLVFSSKPN